MPQRGFSYALVVAGGVLILGMVAFFAFQALKRTPQINQAIPNITGKLIGPSCPEGFVYTVSPIEPKYILSVVPLGNLNPPDHTIPTDHIYLTVKNNNNIEPGSEVPVYAPSDITISRITHQTAKKSGQKFSDDYSLDFSPCKDIQAKFGHLTKLSENLMSIVWENQNNCQVTKPRVEDEYTYCNVELNIKIKAGELLGEAGGGRSNALDFWTKDFRSKPLEYANPGRYRDEQLHIVCPIDLFEPSVKEILNEKFGSYEKKRTIEPLCGSVNQDVAGTAQGNWIISRDGLMDQPEAWDKSLALVHDNVDPNIGVVVIGGVISNPQTIQFNPVQNGNINREFSQVKPDNQIYCYEGNGRMLIQLESETILKAEFQTGSCQESFQFSSPTIYYR